MATKKKAKTCECITAANRELAKEGDAIVVSYSMMKRRPPVAVIATTRIEDRPRKFPVTVLATFCPFCGVKYPEL